ncbi:hypothetical protein Ppb6_03816 [Photorhabdus australis subsp. thailandensis]|uniref:Uncharacterized protein n=1 Tax=Photorhabdus australis subsp. thailandensis TaxID=2805096 RepID=A0A1C0TYH2_9GAMM|nr:hypothetical protein Ppb6_03816 [Photorhabdus australis subsp. thailandensis]
MAVLFYLQSKRPIPVGIEFLHLVRVTQMCVNPQYTFLLRTEHHGNQCKTRISAYPA